MQETEELKRLAYKMYNTFYNIGGTRNITSYFTFLDLHISYPIFIKKAIIESRKQKIQKLKKNILDNR